MHKRITGPPEPPPLPHIFPPPSHTLYRLLERPRRGQGGKEGGGGGSIKAGGLAGFSDCLLNDAGSPDVPEEPPPVRGAKWNSTRWMPVALGCTPPQAMCCPLRSRPLIGVWHLSHQPTTLPPSGAQTPPQAPRKPCPVPSESSQPILQKSTTPVYLTHSGM